MEKTDHGERERGMGLEAKPSVRSRLAKALLTEVMRPGRSPPEAESILMFIKTKVRLKLI